MGPHLFLFLAAAFPFGRQLLLGAGFLDDDVFLQSLPAWEWLSRTLRSGDSLLWSQEMMGGFPIAFTQYPFLYPPDLLLAWLLPPFQAYAWSLVLHLFLAGALTHGFCRMAGLRPGSALLAALSFQMSSEVVAGSSGFAAKSAFLLPGTLLAVELVLRRGPRYGPIAALVVAAGLLGGHPQLVLLGFGAGAAYALFRLVLAARASGVRAALVLGGWLALAAALGVAGAAVRLLPTWEVVALSTRAGGLPGEATGGGLSLEGLLVGYLLPLSRLQTLPWGSPSYAGPAVVVLAVLGARHLVGRPLGRFFLGLGLVATLLAMGDTTPLHGLTRLPLLSLFREPSRFGLVATFSVAVLGGMALEGLWSTEVWSTKGTKANAKGAKELSCSKRTCSALLVLSATAATVFFALGAVFQFGAGPAVEGLRDWAEAHYLDLLNPLRLRMGLAVLGVPLVALLLAATAHGRLSRGQLELALIVATAAVLVPLAAILNPPLQPAVAGKPPETVHFLLEQGATGRIFGHRAGTVYYVHTRRYGPGTEAGFADDLGYRFKAEMLAPVLNLRWGIASADGYEQLHSRYQETLLRYMGSERTSSWAGMWGVWDRITMRERARVLRMLGVRYVLSGMELTAEAPELRPVKQTMVESGPASQAALGVLVLENPNPLPRYYLVAGSREFARDADALDAVALGEVDPGAAVLLPASEGAQATGEPSSGGDGSGGEGSVEVLSLRNAEVDLRVSTQRPAYLVTSDSYWPGWRAFVDGREVPVLRANVGGRAIWLGEGGAHRVAFRFEPPGFAAGLGLSVAAGLLGVVWLLLGLRRSSSPGRL